MSELRPCRTLPLAAVDGDYRFCYLAAADRHFVRRADADLGARQRRSLTLLGFATIQIASAFLVERPADAITGRVSRRFDQRKIARLKLVHMPLTDGDFLAQLTDSLA